MVLEMIDAEALREALSHSPWGRQFLGALFGSPDGSNMFDAQVASSSVQIESHGEEVSGASSSPQGAETILTAYGSDLARLELVREPTVTELIYESDAKKYLGDLHRSLQERIDALRQGLQPVTWSDGSQRYFESVSGMSREMAAQKINELEALQNEIKEIQRRGIPQGQVEDTVKLLYKKVHDLELEMRRFA